MFPDFLNAPQLWVAALLSPTGALMIAEWTGVLLAIVGALVMSMNRSYSRHAWLLWTLSNLLLILPIAHTQRWGLLAMQAAFLIVNVNGWWRHGRRTPATPSRPRSPRQRRAMTSSYRAGSRSVEGSPQLVNTLHAPGAQTVSPVLRRLITNPSLSLGASIWPTTSRRPPR